MAKDDQKWEYKDIMIYLNDFIGNEANLGNECQALGDEGWELVSTMFVPRAIVGTNEYLEMSRLIYSFKRPIESE